MPLPGGMPPRLRPRAAGADDDGDGIMNGGVDVAAVVVVVVVVVVALPEGPIATPYPSMMMAQSFTFAAERAVRERAVRERESR